MTELRNEFSWSKSRDEIFQTCPRQYYFNYYGYWGGWEKNAPEKIRLIEYNLLSDQKAEFLATEGEITNTRGYIKGSIAVMKSLLVESENNIPKDEAAFKKVEDDKIRDRCNFRKVCV